jgi:class 3 adenylate cyclase
VLATVLFSDIVASTERASQLGDRRWRELLNVHDELARRLVEEFGGRLVKTTGDGLLATFDGPGRGIRCAAALRDELVGIGVQLRVGLHTGEVELRDGDVGGIAVHIAARVMAAAGPGEILTSRTVRDLIVAPTSSWTTTAPIRCGASRVAGSCSRWWGPKARMLLVECGSLVRRR